LVKSENGDLPGAQEAIEKAIEIDLKDARLWANLGLVKRENGNLPGAQEAIEKAIEIDPKDAGIWSNLGLVKRENGDLPGAQEAIEKAIEIDPKDAGIWSNLGLVKRANGDLPGAQEAFEKALELEPKDAGFWSNLGLVKRENGDLSGAQEAIEKAIELEPKDAYFWSNLAELKMDSKDHEGLRKVIDRLHTLKHLGLPIFTTYFILTEIGALKLEDAISFLKEANDLKGNEREWREFLSAVTEVMMSGVDITDEAALEAQLKRINEFAKIREQTRPLESLIFVFEYFLARLRPQFVRGGKKMTPKERGKRILAKVPREQRDAIRRLIRQVEKSRKSN
jgi:Flp pilus assembly protein TadD